MKKTAFRFLLIGLCALLTGCGASPAVNPADDIGLIGGQRDAHGCLVPAGYSYDSEVDACVRSWEIADENVRLAASIASAAVSGPHEGLTVVTVVPGRCVGCFYVTFDRLGEAFSVQLSQWVAQ